MSLSIGIVGLPNVGKSTLFNALTRNEVLAANYPFATIEPNVGVVAVPDERLDHLARLCDSERTVAAMVTFVDIAGIVRGASVGEGLGNQFLAAIRETDAICQVVRAFDDSDVIHVGGTIDPADDIATVNTELILADLQTVDQRLSKLTREARMRPELRPLAETVTAARQVLDEGRTISSAGDELDRAQLAELHLLTAKPFIYVFNVDEAGLNDEGRRRGWLRWWRRPSASSCAPRSRQRWRRWTRPTPPNCWPGTASTNRAWSSWSTWGSTRSASRPT